MEHSLSSENLENRALNWALLLAEKEVKINKSCLTAIQLNACVVGRQQGHNIAVGAFEDASKRVS